MPLANFASDNESSAFPPSVSTLMRRQKVGVDKSESLYGWLAGVSPAAVLYSLLPK